MLQGRIIYIGGVRRGVCKIYFKDFTAREEKKKEIS